jgi:lipopolysaccharide/colanic/teichoic acid biosynthesis glycosyltransferase
MIETAENNGTVWASEDDPRVTKAGRVIRLKDKKPAHLKMQKAGG